MKKIVKRICCKLSVVRSALIAIFTGFIFMAYIPYLHAENTISKLNSKGSFSDNDYEQGILGYTLPGTWRPFSGESPWNTPIDIASNTHPDSRMIINLAISRAKHIRLAEIYTIPVWVINADITPHVKVRSDRIFDRWDKDKDGWSDVSVPVTDTMWCEPTDDGHLCIIDPSKGVAWEFSRFRFSNKDKTPRCTTFNIWDLKGEGVGNPFEGSRWWARGGRGSGFPLIAGLIRPEELIAGEIRHALVFTFPENRRAENDANIFLPPASRSDGRYKGVQYPIEGMRFQLDPLLTEKDFDGWGLNREGRIVARALQKYGMLLGDNGGAMSLQALLLAPSKEDNLKKWEKLIPGLYKNVEKIPTDKFRVVYTGEPFKKK